LEKFSNILKLENKDKQDLLDRIEVFYEALESDEVLEELEQLNISCLKSLDLLNLR